MCNYHYFHTVDELNHFADEKGIKISEEDMRPCRMQPDEWLAGLVLDGVTELCNVWRASGTEYIRILCMRGIRVVSTGQVLIPTPPPNHSGCRKPNSWHFKLFGEEPMVFFGQYITPTIQKPNGIGKMSRTGLEKWLDYLNAAKAELEERYETLRKQNREHYERVTRKFPDAEIRYAERGLVQSIKVRTGYLIIIWEAHYNGGFSRGVKIDTSLVPSDDEILAI